VSVCRLRGSHEDRDLQGWVAQLAEQWTENPRVAGSIPAPATTHIFIRKSRGKLQFFGIRPKTPEMKENTVLRRRKCHAASCKWPAPSPCARVIALAPPGAKVFFAGGILWCVVMLYGATAFWVPFDTLVRSLCRIALESFLIGGRK
jgi:hypothetical protein